MINRKLKVVWFCYFSNSTIQNIIKPFKRIGEFAPWITNMIPLFENDEDVELHIVSPHEWISGTKHFVQNEVYYHFFNMNMPFLGRHWPGFFRFDIWTNYLVLKYRFGHIIDRIKPDIIHMHGVENPFCIGIIQFKRTIPIFITIQGFIHKQVSKVSTKRVEKEIEIMTMFNHYGYRTQTMGEDIKKLNQNAVLHWHQYPSKVITPIDVEKKYDLVFFARMSQDKGIIDLLRAVSIIKKQKPEISLCAIGGGKIDKLKDIACQLGIETNISWIGFLPSQNDVYKLAAQAKISVLPTYNDIISGTILESLFLKLPVVAYNVGSIHEVNKNDEIISLVDKGDIEGLSNRIKLLLDNDKLLEDIAEKGRERAIEMFSVDDTEIRDDILKAYKIVIDDFKHNYMKGLYQ